MDKVTRYQTYLMQVQALGYEKEFTGMINNIKYSLKLFKSNEELLLKRRINYDFAYVQVMDEYGLDTTDIYDVLNKTWKECVKEATYLFGKKSKELDTLGEKVVNEVLKYNRVIAEHSNPIMKFTDLKILFDMYIRKCEELARVRVEEAKKSF